MPFARTLGVKVISATPDLVEAEMTIRPDLCTAGGVAHGGVVISLADSLGGLGAFLNLPEGAAGTVTVESKTNLLGSAKSGATVKARTEPVQRGKRLQVWRTDITDEDGKPVALTIQTQLNL
ncbi:PaaI family thioesterase [Pikeienuella piscinae]|uniref:PaaI family thioesterase n=2 Tax=Pikeienuella piscinae TaxID=2748098 RepID=A0A7M3T6U1_9RHOB|nr:PaaI family thioesterase [Pikeienuella piscinae]